MTNKEAIEILKEYETVDDSLKWYMPGYSEAFDMAIKALEQSEPCNEDKGCSNCMYSGRPTYKSPCSECRDKSQWEMKQPEPHEDAVSRQDALDVLDGFQIAHEQGEYSAYERYRQEMCALSSVTPKNMIEIPGTGIGDLSDGYHTFNELYKQRMILFAALVKAYKDKAWKSYRHEDGEYCFGGGWFIVGIDTPEGSYTYHYENQYWDMFDCMDLPRGKHWDGHTEEDAETRLMSLGTPKTGKWEIIAHESHIGGFTHVKKCSVCGVEQIIRSRFCPNCGARMDGYK